MENQELEKEGMDLKNNENGSSESNGENGNSAPRFIKKNNKKVSSKRNAKLRKEEKLDRLVRERDAKKAELKRGYKIVDVVDDEGNESKKHIPLDATERSVVESAIASLENQIFDIKSEIETLEEEIKDLSQTKTSSLRNKLKNKKRDKKISKALKSVERFVKKSSENGQKEVVDDIKYKAQSNKDQEAYQSLLLFLRSEPSPIKRTFSKDPELEDTVIEKLLGKINNGQF